MTEKDMAGAVQYIYAQLSDGYIDLGAHDEDEIEILKEAMELWLTDRAIKQYWEADKKRFMNDDLEEYLRATMLDSFEE